jgi:molybdate transport system ATP-binding protein
MSVLATDFTLKRNGFTLDIKCEIKQQVTGIFGPSGAGKTSFLHVLAGLEKPDSGSVRIHQRDVFNSNKKINLPPEKRKIGFVFQDSRLFPHMNVAQNVRYGIKMAGDNIRFGEVADLLKISNILDKKVSQISGGQAQRVAIGRAILSAPDILFLDEPFSALDKNLRQHIISLLMPLIKKFDIPMLVISHDLSDLLMLTDKLLIIKDGKCVGHGNYYELIAQENTVHELSKSGLINSIQLNLDRIDDQKGIMILSKNGHKIFAESRVAGKVDDANINIFLRPEDITLALHKIEDISIQNQIEGQIKKLVVTDNKVLCIIDHGFKLIAEVTLATKEKMNLHEGAKIWSLFKAAAVKMNTTEMVNSRQM